MGLGQFVSHPGQAKVWGEFVSLGLVNPRLNFQPMKNLTNGGRLS
jgi:hypothetical protein